MSHRLCALDAAGEPLEAGLDLPQELQQNNRGLAGYLTQVGFQPPWVGYVCLKRTGDQERAVGGGAFKGAPKAGKVEIAYFTLESERGQGHASATARWLTALARAADPSLVVSAETLPERNHSTRILERLGFALTGTAQDDEVGTVWHWELAPGQAVQASGGTPLPSAVLGSSASNNDLNRPSAELHTHPSDASDLAPLPATPPGRYRHYKGNLYEVLGVVRHSESLEPLVLYRSLGENTALWVRPHAMFFETIEHAGRRTARFTPA